MLDSAVALPALRVVDPELVASAEPVVVISDAGVVRFSEPEFTRIRPGVSNPQSRQEA